MSLLDRMPDSGAGVDNWVPTEAGETIEGKVIAIDHQPSDFQTDVMIPFITLSTPDGVAMVRGYHTVLRKEIERAHLQVGFSLAIRYDGQQALKKGKFAGRPVHVYTVLAEAPNADGSADVPF